MPQNVRLDGPGFTSPDDGEADYAVVSGVAVIPVHGMIVKRPSWLTVWGLATSVDQLACVVRRASLDGAVRAIVLDVDSPGGRVAGVADCGDVIYGLRGTKTIHAIANDVCCSAGYFLASAAEKVWATQSATVGSIGTKLARLDLREANKLEGYQWTIFETGSLKSAGDPNVPLSDEERTYLQGWVDNVQQGFVAAVSRNRGIAAEQVRNKYGDGRFWLGPEAVSLGLCDGVTTLDRLVSELSGINVLNAGEQNDGEDSGESCDPTPGCPDDGGPECGVVHQCRSPGIRISSR